ncbi:hypothetical protein [Bacillus paramycoides]|uniref:hypothetical protein n=1 Tax=Bacillus paramycoides TaxID=2026194 RepID=UPI002E2292AA|nr:hypothetical protein [Bacillus paramycoides]MED1462546.1 hypothetical protein [Bacillus paramycoides]MED1494011.1 hypothetical protein [Bacillus paramycoides]
MKKYQVIYILISPDGTRDIVGSITIYSTTEKLITQRLDKELQRRMGDLFLHVSRLYPDT